MKKINRYLITLKLEPEHSSFRDIKNFSGLKNLNIDRKYGVINVSSKDNLYVIRASGDINVEQLIVTQPEIKRVHNDSYISAISLMAETANNFVNFFATARDRLVTQVASHQKAGTP